MFSPSNLFKSDPAVEDLEPDPDDEDVDWQRRACVAAGDARAPRLPRVIVTPAILAVIVAIFVVMVVVVRLKSLFSSKTLGLRWGGGAVRAGGRRTASGGALLSAMRPRPSAAPRSLNAIFLWRFGDYVERLLGPVVFLLDRERAGRRGRVGRHAPLQFHGLSVGASGAIFGLCR